MTVDRLTPDEVAERAGTTSEHIALLAKVGILEPEDDGTFQRRDVLRARFVVGLDAMGIDANAVADALASGDLTLGYVEIGGRRPPRSERTFAELSDEIDIPFVTLERIYVAFGLPRGPIRSSPRKAWRWFGPYTRPTVGRAMSPWTTLGARAYCRIRGGSRERMA